MSYAAMGMASRIAQYLPAASLADPMLKDCIAALTIVCDQARADAERAKARRRWGLSPRPSAGTGLAG